VALAFAENFGENPAMVSKIISGGQTGVDRAALDVALDLGFPAGGWCPKGRKAEDGRIPDRYPLAELATESYAVRTRKNVHDADATLVLCLDDRQPSGGTALTVKEAIRAQKPHLVVSLANADAAVKVKAWLMERLGCVLNVAGPPESNSPGIHDAAVRLIQDVLGEGTH
jgi:hypothetical protein